MEHKHIGQPKKIPSPERMLELFEEYIQWSKDNPWIKLEAIKSGERAGELIEIPHERALTEWGFAKFIGISRNGLINYGTKPEYSNYFNIYARIKTYMAEQRISGGLCEAFNPQLVARIDGLSEPHAAEQNEKPAPIAVNITVRKDETVENANQCQTLK